MNFEIIFKEHISDYIKKFIAKIKKIIDFDTIIKLINIKNLKNKNKFLEQLNKKYDRIISNEIGILNEEKLTEVIHVVAKIAIINFVYQEKEKKLDFIKKRIKNYLD